MNFKPIGFYTMTQSVKTSATLSKKENDFLKIFLEKIKNEKSHSENQKRILQLSSNENRSLSENKTLKILLKAEHEMMKDKIENEKLQSKIDDDILKTMKKLLVSKIEVRDLFLDYILEKQFKDNDLMKQYIESLPKIENEKSLAVDSFDSENENSGLIAKTEKSDKTDDSDLAVSTQNVDSENEVKAVEVKNDTIKVENESAVEVESKNDNVEVENEIEAVEDKNDGVVASPKVAQA